MSPIDASAKIQVLENILQDVNLVRRIKGLDEIQNGGLRDFLTLVEEESGKLLQEQNADMLYLGYAQRVFRPLYSSEGKFLASLDFEAMIAVVSHIVSKDKSDFKGMYVLVGEDKIPLETIVQGTEEQSKLMREAYANVEHHMGVLMSQVE